MGNTWSKNDINAHPHISNNSEIVIIHNGIIENFKELKDFLIKNGYKFHTNTDTEVIANLLEYNSKDEDDFTKVIKKTIDEFVHFIKNWAKIHLPILVNA